MTLKYLCCLLLVACGISLPAAAQELYEIPENTQTQWFSFENLTGAKGEGGQENQGAKGHAFNFFGAGETITLMDTEGPGVVQRIWMTINIRTPEILRSVRLDMYWDQAEKPAISVPLGDFFGVGLGQRAPFESVFFSDPEGRSFNCVVPMPFKTGAKITLTNESETDLNQLFYDINIIKMKSEPEDPMYFHAYWNRNVKTELGEDFEILPKVNGKGRFLGTNIGILTNPAYGKTWWGEGEVKMYLDGDSDFPTLIGTGAEDYIGTAYGQGVFDHLYQGSPIADEEAGEFTFYRYHVPDPIYFYSDIKVTLQQMGGGGKEKLQELIAKGAEARPVTVHKDAKFIKLLELENTPELDTTDFPEGWVNFYRRDDVSATAYFYLDRPTSDLPELQSVEIRTANLEQKKE